MVELKEYNFSDLYEMSSGLSSKKEQAGHGAPFVSFRTVFNNYFLPDELDDKMDTNLSEQEIYSVKADDILLTRTSETIDELGMSCVVLNDVPNATYSGFTKRLRPKVKGVVYSKYIGFYLRTKMFRKTMTNNAFMTLRASLNDEIFSYLKLYLPDYQTQVKIGDLLYSLNQKIALNNKTNSELENMAKSIYDYWFTQFDFPDKNGNPYKTSGGQMVYNETLKRDIPAGWESGTFGDLIEIGNGKDHSKLENGEIPVYGSGGLMRKVNKQLYEGESVLFPRKGTLNNVMYANENFWTVDTMFYSIPKQPSTAIYVYYNAKIIDFERMNTGTGVPSMTSSIIKELPIIIPENSVLYSFDSKMQTIYKEIFKNKKENEELTKLRDYLLPLLMNGQIEVK